MPRAALNVCSIEAANVEGLEDTPPPVDTGAAAFFVFVGFGVTAFVAVGFGVLVGSGVAVGAGVFVGWGVSVSGIGVFVGTAVGVCGTSVEVGGSVGSTVGVASGADVPQPANMAIIAINIRKH